MKILIEWKIVYCVQCNNTASFDILRCHLHYLCEYQKVPIQLIYKGIRIELGKNFSIYKNRFYLSSIMLEALHILFNLF